MVKQQLSAYLSTKFEDLDKHFFRTISSLDCDAIHDFRVNVKQLRAFFSLIEAIQPGFNAKKNIFKIRNIFKKLGKSRDIHVQQALARTWPKNLEPLLNDYRDFLNRKELETGKKALKALKDKSLKKALKKISQKVKKGLSCLSEEYVISTIESYTDSLMRELLIFGNKHKFSQENLHKLRIITKKTRYIIEIKQYCNLETPLFSSIIEKMAAVHKILGKWHDYEVAQNYITLFLNEKGTPELMEKSQLKNEEKQLADFAESKKLELLDSFKNVWETFHTFLKES